MKDLENKLKSIPLHQPSPDFYQRVLDQKQISQEPQTKIHRFFPNRLLPAVAALAACLIAALILWHLTGGNGANMAYAEIPMEVFDQIEKAQTITWKTTYYVRVSNKDGTKTWVESIDTKLEAYKAPGRYRDVRLDENMEIKTVRIYDLVQSKELVLMPPKKQAIVYNKLRFSSYNLPGPFNWINKWMQEHPLEWVGKKETATGEVNVFRSAYIEEWTDRKHSYDFWIDTQTKQLVAYYGPGADIYDPEKDPPIIKLPEDAEAWRRTALAFAHHDINYNAQLDDSLFSLEPPAGYAVEVQNYEYPRVTEKEFVDYIGIMAEANEQTFPDELISPGATFSKFTVEMHNKIRQKPESDRTPAEQKLLETELQFASRGVNATEFIFTDTVENSYQYLGKGVKLGDKDRIVCWYQLKSTKTFRAVYGDLSVRDVDPENLPLKVIKE